MDPEEMWDEHPVLNVFTKVELQELGMLELADAQRPSLTNAIHPIFLAANWAHRIEIPRSVAVGPIYRHTLSIFQRDYDFVTRSYALSKTELVRTQEALVSLAGFVTITINRAPSAEGAVLTTSREFESPSPTSFPGTASLIEIDRKYVDAYARPDLTISQRLRLQFYLAVSLVHELSHAVEMAVTPMLPRSPNRHGPTDWRDWHHPDEPFFERDRLAECGNAWENNVLGGLQNLFGSTVARYGLVTRKWPTITDPAKDFELELPIRGKPKKWTTIYFVPMSHVQRLFTDQFWSHEGIGRYGAGAVKSKHIYGWRAFNEGEITSNPNEGISWGDSSRERAAGSDGKIEQPPLFENLGEDMSLDPFDFIDWTAGQG